MSLSMPAALAVRRCDPELRNFTKSGGRTGTGREQRTFADAGFWAITLEIVANTRERVLAAREMMSRLRQGEEVAARVCDVYKATGNSASLLVSAAALRATTIRIKDTGVAPDAGTRFSIGDRLHQITQVVAEVEAPAGVIGFHDGDVWNDWDAWTDSFEAGLTIKFLPPLRAAAVAGDVVKFSDLSCLCVLQDINDGDLSLELLRHGTATLTLVESI